MAVRAGLEIKHPANIRRPSVRPAHPVRCRARPAAAAAAMRA